MLFEIDRRHAMKPGTFLKLLCLATAAGCAQFPGRESPEHAARMTGAGNAYLACLTREAEKDAKSPAGAEDIATAAHARCWSAWDIYRSVTNTNFFYNARTADEKQYARDRAEAHLREFEREARRVVIDLIIERTLKAGTSPGQ
jgi:hypothetical protein